MIQYYTDLSALKKLRNALAIIHCKNLISVFQKEAEVTISHDQAKRVTYLTEWFSRIHRDIFQNWREQATVSQRPGTIVEANKRRAFREVIESLVLNDDESKTTALFDNNGFVIKTENIAERLAKFYFRMRQIKPFEYGNKLTLDFFMVALGSLPAFSAVYEQGIDFRRIDPCDAMVLHNYKSDLSEVIDAFRRALEPTRTRSLENTANGYGRWPDYKKFVFGMSFLSHTTQEGIECLVTVNGGLVPLADLDDKFIALGVHFSDYPPVLPENIIGYLPGTESLRASGKTDIDGIPISETGVAPLFCLDINMLTGLRSPSHTEFVELLRQVAGENTSIFTVAHNMELKNKLISAAKGDRRLERSVEIAYERLGKVATKLDREKAAIFEGKTPDSYPKLFLCMGGAGVGKTAVEEIATAQCGENFVVASLDEFRKKSDLYLVLTAANHHSDDYIFVEPFANTLRDWVSAHAREAKINLLYDGTSIPYVPRYSHIVESFKEKGFNTLLSAVDAFIVKPRGREGELPRAAAIFSVKDRFQKTGRALPWVVAVDKHIRAPGAFLNALEHYALDKLALFANDGEKDKHYLVAESFPLSDIGIHTLHRHQRESTLSAYIRSVISTHETSTLRHLADSDPAKIEQLLERNPHFSERNVAYLIHTSKSGDRVLLIYNTRRMVDFLEKGQLNPNSSGEEGLLHKHRLMAFHVDPSTDEPWMIRLQDSSRE